MRMHWGIVAVGILGVAGLVAAAGHPAADARAKNSAKPKQIGRVGLGVGYQPPGFSGRDLTGVRQSLEDSGGKVTVLHFWASWCGYCRTEIPELTQLHNGPQSAQVRVVTVSVDQDLKTLRQFVQQHKLPYPVLADQELEPSVADQYGISGIPVTYVISADGYISQRLSGAGEITEAVRAALGESSGT